MFCRWQRSPAEDLFVNGVSDKVGFDPTVEVQLLWQRTDSDGVRNAKVVTEGLGGSTVSDVAADFEFWDKLVRSGSIQTNNKPLGRYGDADILCVVYSNTGADFKADAYSVPEFLAHGRYEVAIGIKYGNSHAEFEEELLHPPK